MAEQCWRRTAHAVVPQALLEASSGSNALFRVVFAVEAAASRNAHFPKKKRFDTAQSPSQVIRLRTSSE